jgi:hypothetical protein
MESGKGSVSRWLARRATALYPVERDPRQKTTGKVEKNDLPQSGPVFASALNGYIRLIAPRVTASSPEPEAAAPAGPARPSRSSRRCHAPSSNGYWTSFTPVAARGSVLSPASRPALAAVRYGEEPSHPGLRGRRRRHASQRRGDDDERSDAVVERKHDRSPKGVVICVLLPITAAVQGRIRFGDVRGKREGG